MKLLLLAAALASSQETASFLNIGVGARALGMGGAYTALADDVNTAGWNPAGLAALSRREVGVAQPTRFGTLGAAGSYLSHGTLEGRDAQGRPTGGFSAADSVVALSYARGVSAAMLGGSLKFAQSRIAFASGEAVAADLGARLALASFGPGRPLLGAAVQNLGSGMRLGDQTAPLPLTLSLGAGSVSYTHLTLPTN